MKLNPFPWDLYKSGPPFNFMGTTFLITLTSMLSIYNAPAGRFYFFSAAL